MAESDLEQIPGVGPKMAVCLREIGIFSINDLRGKSAERLYEKLCSYKAAKVDRCVLYVFRCAVYFANNQKHDPELLQWWNWKD